MPNYDNSLSQQPKRQNISTAHCPFCDELLAEGQTVKEVNAMFPDGYHPHCHRRFLKQTEKLSGSFAAMLENARKRAAKKGWDYDLDSGGYDDSDGVEFLTGLYRRQGGRCALTRMEFLPSIDSEWKFYRTPSLDRIDSSKGYTRGNVQIVIQAVQYLKFSMPDEQLVEISQAVIDTAKLKKPANRKRTAKTVTSSKPARGNTVKSSGQRARA